MVNEDTELIFIDEWCEKTLAVDDVKMLFQGGWLVKAIKHHNATTISNNAGMFITCNKMPDFGEENVNVLKRISVFNTKELEDPVLDAPKWIHENAMQCLVWVINEINEYIDMIPKEERFYETKRDSSILHSTQNSFQQSQLDKLMALKPTDIADISIQPQIPVNNFHLSEIFDDVFGNDDKDERPGPSRHVG